MTPPITAGLAGQVAMAAAALVYLTDRRDRWEAFIKDMTAAGELGPAGGPPPPAPGRLTREYGRQAAVDVLGLSIAILPPPRYKETGL